MYNDSRKSYCFFNLFTMATPGGNEILRIAVNHVTNGIIITAILDLGSRDNLSFYDILIVQTGLRAEEYNEVEKTNRSYRNSSPGIHKCGFR